MDTNDGSFTDEQFKKFLKLTDLQQGFVQYKMMGFNNTEAYLMAGGTAATENDQRVCGHELSTNPNVKSLLADIARVNWEAATMTREEMGARLTEIAMTTIGDLLDIQSEERHVMDMETGEELFIKEQTRWSLKPLEEMKGAGVAMIKELTTTKDGGYKVKFHDQLQAKKQLAELMGYNKPQELVITAQKGLADFYADSSD